MMFTSGLLLGIGIGMVATVVVFTVAAAWPRRQPVGAAEEIVRFWAISTRHQSEQIEVLRDILTVIARKDEVK